MPPVLLAQDRAEVPSTTAISLSVMVNDKVYTCMIANSKGDTVSDIGTKLQQLVYLYLQRGVADAAAKTEVSETS